MLVRPQWVEIPDELRLSLKVRNALCPGIVYRGVGIGRIPRRKARFCAQRTHGLGKRNPLRLLSENFRSMRNSGNKIQQNI